MYASCYICSQCNKAPNLHRKTKKLHNMITLKHGGRIVMIWGCFADLAPRQLNSAL